MTLVQVLDACRRAGASAVYCTPLSPSWLLVHVDLDAPQREAFARALRPYHRGVRVTVGEA